MLLLDQKHNAGALAVERRRDVQDGLLDDLLDLGVGDGALLLEGVVGAAGLDGLEEGFGRHACGGGREVFVCSRVVERRSCSCRSWS